MQTTDSTLICTLGTQPQVVCFALDYLLAQGEHIRKVMVIHLSGADGREKEAVARLEAEFAGGQYRGVPCRFQAMPLQKDGLPLAVIHTAVDAEAVRGQIYTLIQQLKRASMRPLHLCIAGGPRILALTALSAAQLYCGHQDRVWHMVTEPAFLAQAKAERLLHDENGKRTWLVPVPVVPWGAYFSPLAVDAPTPEVAVAVQSAWLDEGEHRRCEKVWAQLTERQQDVLRAFALGGTPQSVAEDLVISIKTVNSHKTVIMSLCRIAWEVPDETYLAYYFLREKFRIFVEEYTPAGEG